MEELYKTDHSVTLIEAMSQAWQTSQRHIVLTGDGGTGKSTLLASTFLQLVTSDTVVPLYFDLSGDLSGMGEKETIQHRLITDYCGQLENETCSQALYKLFSGGGALPAPRYVFLIDGINESETPGQYLTEINRFMQDYDSVQIVLAGRDYFSVLGKCFSPPRHVEQARKHHSTKKDSSSVGLFIDSGSFIGIISTQE